MYQLIPLHSCDYLKKISIQINVATEEGNIRNEMDTEQTMKLEWLYKVGSEWELNSWPDSSLRACKRNSVVMGSNPTQANFL